MKKALRVQLLLVIFGTAAAYFLGSKEMAVSFMVGGATILVNYLLLMWSWTQILYKKSIAMGFFVIVSKYAILAAVVYSAHQAGLVHQIALVSGLATILISGTFKVYAKEEDKPG
jgi:hypothetical protein